MGRGPVVETPAMAAARLHLAGQLRAAAVAYEGYAQAVRAELAKVRA
jgi:hypothetical protein